MSLRRRWLTPLVAALVGTACGASPASPLTPAPGPSAPSILSITIAGVPATLAAGETAQLSVRAAYSDGSVETPASGVLWSVRTSACSVTALGLVTASVPGDCTVDAVYAGLTASAALRVPEPAVFTISGVVRERFGIGEPGLPAATVTILNGAQSGRRVTADASGVFSMSGVPNGAVQIQADASGFERSGAVVSPDAPSTTFRLDPSLSLKEHVVTAVFPGPGYGDFIPFRVVYRGPVTVSFETSYPDCGSPATSGLTIMIGTNPWQDLFACTPNVPSQITFPLVSPGDHRVFFWYNHVAPAAGAVRRTRIWYPGG